MLLASLIAFSSVVLPPVMPVADVKPGQHGECLTVFQGDKVEPFPFVVRGTMPNFLGPDRDVVLIRLEGEKAEFTGVVAGMSGSPCSIDGKLVGALAYSFATFAKEPIAGITPIGDMLSVMKVKREERPWRVEADKAALSDKADGAKVAISVGTSASEWQALRDGQIVVTPKSDTQIRPIATPLAISGMPQRVIDHFAPWLENAGFMAMAGGSSGKNPAATKLVPGSAIAAVLVRGAVNIAATGTVTSVEGNEVTAFGHPFFGAGAVSIPMANASIVNTMVSTQRSFKMAVPGANLGEVTQDRLTAIGGILGGVPSMVPVTGALETPDGPAKFELEVSRDLELTPRFVAMGLAGALSGRVDAGTRGTLRFTGTIHVDGMKPIVIKNVYSAQRDGSLMTSPAIDVAMAFASMWSTPFAPPPKMSVSIDAQLSSEPIEETIEDIVLDRSAIEAGKPVEVAVRIRRTNGPVTYEKFSLQVPRSWIGDNVDIIAASADVAERVADEVSGAPRPNDLGDIVRVVNAHRADGNVYLMAVRDGVGMRSRVDVLQFIPPSAIATLSGDPMTHTRSRGLAWEEKRARPGTLSGSAITSLKVVAP
ncbi:MAG: hypothetical protein H7Z43_15950 [Clostridia bacterium]|nr:hypothetical protein [Deltaproteobacteria bacterium]